MWIAGVMQGLMWRATNPDGTLTYTFVESLKATYPYYMVRLGGGLLFLIGMFLMLYNVIKTNRARNAQGRAARGCGGGGTCGGGGAEHLNESRIRRKECMVDGSR